MRHNYRYIKFYTPKGVGYAVVSIEWQKLGLPVDGQNRLSYVAGVAFCNPRDHFDKSFGRKIADGRLNKEVIGPSQPVPCSASPHITNAEFNSVLPDIVLNFVKFDKKKDEWVSRAPEWAVDALLAGRYDLGLKERTAQVISLDAAFDTLLKRAAPPPLPEKSQLV